MKGTESERKVESLQDVLRNERQRLVRLCAHITGDGNVAEDLAQETLLEAWKHIHELRDSLARDAWLSGIARNICRRWARSRGRESAIFSPLQMDANEESLNQTERLADDFDLEIELERSELSDLLDRAMSLLSSDARRLLVEKYIEENSLAEIAGHMGLSQGTVAVRLHRGKLALKRVLTTDMRAEMVSYGLVDATKEELQETRIWCPFCGRHKLVGHFIRRPDATGHLLLHCHSCFSDSGFTVTNTYITPWCFSDVLGKVKGFKAAQSRMATWLNSYYRPALAMGAVRCLNCRRMTPVLSGLPDRVSLFWRGKPGLSIRCQSCDMFNAAESLVGLVLCLPEVRRFWRDNPRMRLLPQQEVEAGGRPATVTGFTSITGQATVEVVSDRHTFEVIGVHGSVNANATEN